MISILLIYSIVVGLIIIACVIAFILYQLSFKNRAFIARQTGNSTDNVIWIQDKFKVVRKDGYYFIKFKNLRMKTANVEGKFWTKFFKPKDVPKELKMDKEEWESREMSKKIQRGIYFYENNNGQFFPMSIEFKEHSANFNVLDNDNTRWLANEIKEANDLTRNRGKEILLLALAIVCVVVLALVFIFGIIYLNETGARAISVNQEACTGYINKLLNYTQTIQKNNGFINGVNDVVVGG